MDRDTDHSELPLLRAKRLATLFDSAFRIPGTSWRIGWDSLIGLIPGIGDTLSTGVSLWIIREARQLGVPKRLQFVMFWRLLIDLLIGASPIIGDLFDAAFKANQRNVRTVEQWLEQKNQLPRRDT